MQRRSPDASAGLIMLLASIVPPDAEPAPMMVWISSMNSTAVGTLFSAASTAFRRFSKSPRYLVPATRAPRRSEEHTSELQSLMRISYVVFCLQKKKTIKQKEQTT